jgi:hypothetical protein
MAGTAGQGQTPMVQLQPSRAAEAEFVICDQTIEFVQRYRYAWPDEEWPDFAQPRYHQP